MKWSRVSRRHFLQGAGVAVAAPLLQSIAPKSAQADTTPKSFIGIAAFNGLYRMYGPTSQLMPKTPESGTSLVGFTETPIAGRHAIHSGKLSAIAAANGGAISDIIDSSYQSLLPKMMMLQGFDYTGLGWF